MNLAQRGQDHQGDRFLPLMLILFVGSGCSALIYEIVWFQMLQLVIGSSAISLGVLLGTFMGGMCLGSLFFPGLVGRKRHPLRVYAALELLIGVCAVVLLFLLPRTSGLYIAWFGGGASGIALRAVICFVALLFPTFLMGATLPAIARWMETTPAGVARMGMFYGANIAGAVFGCLLAGFYLLRVFDIQIATAVGVGINLLVGLIALAISTRAEYKYEETDSPPESLAPARWTVYLVIALSGFSALGAEVVWTRIQSLLLGATVYTFSIVLAVFLIGLGIGSSFGAWLSARLRRPDQALGICQILVVISISWSAYILTQSLPYWPIDVSLSSSPWISFQMDFVRSAWAVLPAACCWGASFPLALAAVAHQGQDPGRLVGRVYAANTIGAIAGSMLFSVLLISQLGTLRCQQVLMVCAAIGALIMLAPWRIGSPGSRAQDNSIIQPGRAPGLTGFLRIPVIVVIAGLSVWSVAPVPDGLIGYGRYYSTFLPPDVERPNFIYSGEGMNASIAVSEWENGTRNFHVSGKVVASSEAVDMKLQRMLGFAPALMHPAPKSVLIVGCGAGVTAGSFVNIPGIERIVICEIEPLIPEVAGKYFDFENGHVMDDPRLQIIYDDARHFIATTAEKFDIITSDPIHPWVKGAASLYSLEYFELCKKRLNEGGFVTQWVPLYESSEEAVKSQITTFIRAFPDGTLWGNESDDEGYDLVLLGQTGPTRINVSQMNERLAKPDFDDALVEMAQVDLGTPIQILSNYAGQGSDLQEWVDDQYINRDVNFRLQYLAGMGINSYEEVQIYRSLLKHRKFPENIFQDVSDAFKNELAKELKIKRQSQQKDPESDGE